MEIKDFFLSQDKVATLRFFYQHYSKETSDQQPALRPALIVVPGGGYTLCADMEGDPVALTFAKKGYHTFVLNYHCGEESAYPQPLIDLAMAIALIRENTVEWGVDPNQLAILGFSAGGHLAALYSSVWSNPELANLTGFNHEKLKINAAILGYPVVNLEDFDTGYNQSEKAKLFKVGKMLGTYNSAADPIKRINANTTSTFIFHAIDDQIAPAKESCNYVQKLLQHQVKCEFHLFSRGGHAFSTGDGLSNSGKDYPVRLQLWVKQATNWLNELFAIS